MNQPVAAKTPADVVWAGAVRVRPRDGALECVNAGHPNGLLIRANGSLERLESTMPLLHPALPRLAPGVATTRLGLQDRLVLVTDGVFEARNADGEEFGIERLEAAVRAAAGASSPAGLLTGVLDAWTRFVGSRPADDDRTVLVLERS